MEIVARLSFRGIALSLFFVFFPSVLHADPLVFLSTQMTPVTEAEAMRHTILKGFPGEVDFQPSDSGLVHQQVAVRKSSTDVVPGILGGLHGDFVSLAEDGMLDDIGDVQARLKDRGFIEKFLELGHLGGRKQQYIPWMQATYIMAANRKALKHLPKGADVNALTYEQLIDWGANMKEATGEPKIGFPVSRGGLIHRFVQGYVYPSYTGGTVRNFRSPEALAMWDMMKRLWLQVTPRSLTFSHMQAPLLTGEVWVGWDHTARLKKALEEKPDDFVVFPAPAGPKGRGFMVVLAGLAIPTTSPDRATAANLIDHLTLPDTQIKTLASVGFFPVVATDREKEIPTALMALKVGVDRQSSAADALPALLPAGLGDMGRDFNAVYSATFSRIVLRGKEAVPILEKNAKGLRDVMMKTGARCWPPDIPSEGACPVD
ncbi:MAG: carbohydrate ABC transporter substrate-binding protein [Rhodospirillales bacterium]|nr:carbohydrate ABC transporter substrate-binding protein [Rhodospirillales bacterium]